MYSKMQRLIHGSILLVLVLFGAGRVAAATDPAVDPAAASATSATLRGHISDPTGALIPGAKIVIANASGIPIASATADAAGAYSVNNLTPGSYYVQASYDGFAPFQSALIPLEAGQVKHVHITMAIEVAQQNVVVTEESAAVSTEAGANTDSVVLKGKDLDALSDDPDELSNELSALAGPSAGPNGGQIYIDGFSGGQLPPKSAIREIRINQNPFSAEFDRLGYGRIEILTKPGTDKLHGQFFIMGNDKPFNTSNPFTTTVPAYHSYQFNGTLNGALSKTASFFLSAERRDQQNVNAWGIPDAILPNDSTPGSNCTVVGIYMACNNYGVNLLSPHIRNNLSARFDVQLGAKQTLTARYGFWSEDEQGNLSTGSLATASTHESNTDHTVQISDSIILNDHAVNEIRFQYERQNENHYPDSTDRTISISGDFTGGGYSGQESLDHTTRLELWDITTLSHNKHAIKFGFRARDNRDANLTNANSNGSFTFEQPGQYLTMANALYANSQTPETNSFNTEVAALNGPTSASYTTSKTGSWSALANVFDLALFAQDDWKLNPRLTLSGGIRWEAQNHISDKDDWAPRLALAYALDGNGKDKKAKTVLRAGYGFFYDRMGSGNLLTINRSHIQQKFVINNPECNSADSDCLYATSLGAINMPELISSSGSTTTTAPVQYQVAPGYHAPVTEQLGASIERQLYPGATLTLTYLRSLGVHQLVTRNANQMDSQTQGYPLDASGAYIYQYYSEAVFKQNQFITSINAKVTKNFSLMGSYTLAAANSNVNGNASNAYNLDQDYGRASFVSRNMLFLMGSYTAPWGIRLNPFLVAQSGRPFNIVLPTDTLNNFGNQRPGQATKNDYDSDPTSGKYVSTALGYFNVQPTAADTLIPVNMGNGPAAVALNLRISRGFGIGPKLASASNTDGGGGPPPGGGRGGPGGGGPGGGLGPGGLGGGGGGGRGMFGSTSTGRKYSLNFSVQALNLFNDIDYGTPSGTIVPTADKTTGAYGAGSQFDRSTSLAGGIFSTGSAARRIFAQAVFSF